MIAARAQRPVRATVDIDDSNAGLSQADGRGEASRPSPDDDHVPLRCAAALNRTFHGSRKALPLTVDTEDHPPGQPMPLGRHRSGDS